MKSTMIAGKLLMALSLVLFTATTSAADPLVYVVTTNFNNFTGEFGTMDPITGTFNQVGSVLADPLFGLVPGANGNLLGISGSGNLDSINPATGAVSVIGAIPVTNQPGNAPYTIAELNGTVYATDLYSNLYTLNTTTGAAKLIGPTGIPQCPSLISNVEVSDEMLFTYGGKLYATFDGINLNTLAPVDSPELYQINPATGVATLVDPTALGLNAAVLVNNTLYGFAYGYTGPNTVLSLNPANGNTTFVTDSPMGFNIEITGAAATPEPVSFTLAGIGIAAVLVVSRRRKRLSWFRSTGQSPKRSRT